MGDKEEHWEREKSSSMRNTRTTEGTQKLGERGKESSRKEHEKSRAEKYDRRNREIGRKGGSKFRRNGLKRTGGQCSGSPS